MKATNYTLTNWEIFKNTLSLTAALSGTIGALNPSFLTPAIYYISAYMFFDLLYARRDMFLHHICGLSFFSIIQFYDSPVTYLPYITTQVIRFEYSTIFYAGGPLLMHFLSSRQNATIDRYIPTIKTGLHSAFACTFLKFRICDFAVRVIFQKNTYDIRNFSGIVPYIHLISTVWIFYALNLYWLQLIIIRLFSSKKNRNTNT